MGARPAYLRIAAELRLRIRDGTYPPGARIPTAAELRKHYQVSEIVIRMAVAVLRNEGLVVSRTRAGTRVREHPPVRRVAAERYRSESGREPDDPPSTSFTLDRGISWPRHHLHKEFSEVAANADIAALFELEPGTPLLRRYFVFYADDTPQQLSTTYMPLWLVAGTPVADPANEPWPGGTPAQLAGLGHSVTRVEESVKARMPVPRESEVLDIAAGVPVFVITRRMLARERVLEVAADIVVPADRTILDYCIDLG